MAQKEYRKAVIGTNEQKAGLIFKTGAPLDDRTAVANKESLISQSALGANKTADTGWLFNGLITCTYDNGDVYTLYNRSALKLYSDDQLNTMSEQEITSAVAEAWVKLPSKTDIKTALDANKKELFTFKGVASAIDADHCTLTKGVAKVGNTTITLQDSKTDVEGNLFYYWGTIGEDAVWTAGPLKNGAPIYTMTVQTDVKQFTYNEWTYYQADDTQTNNRTPFMNTEGDTYWMDAKNKIYNTPNSDEVIAIIDSKDIKPGKDIYFSEKTDKTVSGLTDASEPIRASDGKVKVGNETIPSNTGHVYQIGEEEYASNGTIWVQLGSPKEDWIVIK